ncbi:MAG: hypothetical protein LBU55_05610 [Elusimicrobiota bacterium]|nr:hypothetical protein [Elusimicrobiota bacterium]
MAKTTKISRSTVTGKFVTNDYAKNHPKTTVRETIKEGKIEMAKATKVSRSAITGKFVTGDYAKDHPKTTVRETVKKNK